MAKTKAKTIKIVFVKENDIGYLIEGKQLSKYNTLHSQSIAAYKNIKGMIEAVRGKKIACQIIEIEKGEIDKQEFESPTNRIVIFKDDASILILEGNAFKDYQEYHFVGLALLKEEQNIKGRLVKVKIT
jgi:hypothetical protein